MDYTVMKIQGGGKTDKVDVVTGSCDEVNRATVVSESMKLKWGQ